MFLTLNWYEPDGEREVTFDNVQELAKFLKERPGIAEKVGYGRIT